MKPKYEANLDANFEKALELCSNSYLQEDLISFLRNGNIPERQFAALEISELKNASEAEIFISNLINCDGKIREAIAQKLTEFMNEEIYAEYFSKFPDILAKSTIDINANISRMVIDSLLVLRNNKEFGTRYAEHLVKYIKEAFEGLDKIIFRDKKYTINKQMFKLYWCLEGLNNFYKYLDEDLLIDILEKSIIQSEYTVREKAAQLIAKNYSNPKFARLFSEIQNDENYYVRQFINIPNSN